MNHLISAGEESQHAQQMGIPPLPLFRRGDTLDLLTSFDSPLPSLSRCTDSHNGFPIMLAHYHPQGASGLVLHPLSLSPGLPNPPSFPSGNNRGPRFRSVCKHTIYHDAVLHYIVCTYLACGILLLWPMQTLTTLYHSIAMVPLSFHEC